MHVARLIALVIFLILALNAAAAGGWVGTIIWGLAAYAVGYPFIVHRSFSYEDPEVVYLVPN
jgi:hypothetical protein